MFIQIFVICMVLTQCVGSEKKELSILGLYPFTGHIWPGGLSCYVAVQIAFDDINSRTDMLVDYKLVQDYIDTEGDPGTAVYRMVQMLHEKSYMMLMGPISSAVAMATASVSHHWNLTQISFAAASPVFSNQKRYPNFYRVGMPDKAMNAARIGLLHRFGWKKIATIHYAVEFFSTMMDDFINDVSAHNITVFTQQVFVKDPITQIKSLKENDARIIMTAMYEDKAREVLCVAYKIGLYGPKIVWLMLGFYSSGFWKTNLDSIDCTEEEMIIVSEGIFLFKSSERIIERRGLANITYSELMKRVYDHPNYNPNSKPFDAICDNCFDTAWTAALALNCTVATQQNTGSLTSKVNHKCQEMFKSHDRLCHPKTLSQFRYSDPDINDIIYTCMTNTSFLGVFEPMVFDTNRGTLRSVQIERIQDDERQVIGYHIQDKVSQHFDWLDDVLHWKGGKIPRDSTDVTKKEFLIPAPLYTAMCICATIGIAIAACFFTFNIVFKDNRFVKLSSPNINNLLLVGCILCYTVIFIKSIEVSSAVVCQIRVVCFCLGFTITFGSLFSKTWRVYRIFTNKKLQRMHIKDIQLLAIIGVLVAIVLLVLTIWEVVSPHKVVIRLLEKEISIIGNDEEIHPYVRACQSDTSYFDWVLYIMEGLLLAFGAFLAWETRQVKIAALNDSHEIGLCLYNVVILSAVGLTLSLLLEEQEVALYGVTSGCLLMGTTLTQLVVFIPKLHAVYNKIDVHVDDSTTVTAGGSSSRTSVPNKSMSGVKFTGTMN